MGSFPTPLGRFPFFFGPPDGSMLACPRRLKHCNGTPSLSPFPAPIETTFGQWFQPDTISLLFFLSFFSPPLILVLLLPHLDDVFARQLPFFSLSVVFFPENPIYFFCRFFFSLRRRATFNLPSIQDKISFPPKLSTETPGPHDPSFGFFSPFVLFSHRFRLFLFVYRYKLCVPRPDFVSGLVFFFFTAHPIP